MTLLTGNQATKLVNTSKSMGLYVIPQVEIGDYNKILPAIIQIVLDAYADVFNAPKGLTPVRAIQHTIDLLPGISLPNQAPYRAAPIPKVKLERQLAQLIDEGKIQPSCSPYGSPTILIPKKHNDWQLCIDHRAHNKVTVKNRYPLPCIDNLLD